MLVWVQGQAYRSGLAGGLQLAGIEPAQRTQAHRRRVVRLQCQSIRHVLLSLRELPLHQCDSCLQYQQVGTGATALQCFAQNLACLSETTLTQQHKSEVVGNGQVIVSGGKQLLQALLRSRVVARHQCQTR